MECAGFAIIYSLLSLMRRLFLSLPCTCSPGLSHTKISTLKITSTTKDRAEATKKITHVNPPKCLGAERCHQLHIYKRKENGKYATAAMNDSATNVKLFVQTSYVECSLLLRPQHRGLQCLQGKLASHAERVRFSNPCVKCARAINVQSVVVNNRLAYQR